MARTGECGMKKNPVARDLRSPKYRKRVVRSKKAYTRKKKPAGEAGLC